MNALDHFETDFQSRITGSDADARSRAGALLPIIPSRAEWDLFLAAAKASWPAWREKPESYPTSLVVLYGGLAFFEYEDAVFWPKFAAAVGAPDKVPVGSLYQRLNEVYCASVERLGLKLISDAERTSYVGSAVHHIGIPLSLWDGFLDICDWALVREGWRDISPADWETAVTRISGSRRRLKTFLSENRESASDIIAEMIEAHQWLATDPNLTIEGIKQACLLRSEYFDEVPETAEFLRPDSPDSLFRDRPRLSWNEQKGSIVLHVPGLAHEKLPATWTVDGNIFKAGGTPGEMLPHSTLLCLSG